jgi:hypothetical protein
MCVSRCTPSIISKNLLANQLLHAAKTKTYNSGDSPMVTHLTTKPPVSLLSTTEQTGNAKFEILWSYVQDLPDEFIFVCGGEPDWAKRTLCRNCRAPYWLCRAHKILFFFFYFSAILRCICVGLSSSIRRVIYSNLLGLSIALSRYKNEHNETQR